MKNLIYILIALTFLACNNDDDNTNDPAVQTGPVAFITIHRDYLSNLSNPSLYDINLVIDNNTDWTNLMDQMDMLNSNGITMNFSQTNIDFNNFMVIAIFRELFPHIEYVEITEVMENATDIEVTTVDSNFNSGFTQLSQPYHIIMIPKTSKPIVFL